MRAFTHSGLRTALNKVKGANTDQSVQELFRRPGAFSGPILSPIFAQRMARTFIDAQAKREDADNDLNEPFSEADANSLNLRAERAMRDWNAADSADDRDFKHALCLLFLLKGQLRRES